jgi:hypothetical protein
LGKQWISINFNIFNTDDEFLDFDIKKIGKANALNKSKNSDKLIIVGDKGAIIY